MVLCQIAITSSARTEYPVNIAGKVKFRILGIHYANSGSGIHELIQLRSDRFQTTHSSRPNAILFTNIGGDHSAIPIMQPLEFEGEMYNSIDFQLLTITNGAPTNFQCCVVTMDIIPRENNF